MTGRGTAVRDELPTEIVLDLSRLLARILRTTPTGVDRVELAYARVLLARVPERLAFGARFPHGVYGRLDRDAVRRFLAHVHALWEGDEGINRAARAPDAARYLLALRPRRIPPRQGGRVFLQVSPHQLERQRRMRRILAGEDARFAVLVHDLIPLTHPEYARPEGAVLHRRRIATIEALADAAIVNSAATRDSLLATIHRSRPLPVTVAHLGAEIEVRPAVPPPLPDARPYFVCVGTIEARKNHLLLLNVWRRLAVALGTAVPMLHLVGTRGWENEQVVDMLERCPALAGHVVEHSDMPDTELSALLGGARALVLPSFVEGFGMPVAEALALGVPVLAADIPALREVGGAVPDYLDPLDGLGWAAAIVDYAQASSGRRAAQRDRMAGWRPTSWEEHIDAALRLIDSL